MSSKHTYLSHTADIAFDVEADSLEELFTEAFKGWLESVVEITNVEPSDELDIKLKSDSLEQLLVDFLNEINFLLTVKKILCLEVKKIEVNTNKFLMRVLLGTVELNDNFILKEEIKSVTYHQMEIRQENGKYFVRVVFDI
ncbi:MAG: archease [Ignavibacterium sp.]|jgi:SHS2 domain-containing protein|uniref:archease n=1 Tax=Ignavibacterium sp. TaxID=2651167 RepID=UPI00329870E3